MTIAEKAVVEFDKMEVIPNLGQRMQEVALGTFHIFPDGSVAIHKGDATFTLVEQEEV